jgi:hypothetical protein
VGIRQVQLFPKLVFIPLLAFAPVPYFHLQFKRLEATRTRGTELKPFFTILGTSMRIALSLN